MASPDPLHILVLTDRDWTHPQGGGTGTNLFGQIARWVAWGHRVTVIAGDYDGAAKVEQLAPNLTIHRMGTRTTVFPRAAWATLRGVGRDADVVLEVVNGIAFFTPFWRWLRAPRVALSTTSIRTTTSTRWAGAAASPPTSPSGFRCRSSTAAPRC